MRRMKGFSFIPYGILYLVFMTVFALMFGSLNWHTYYRLSTEGIRTNAFITKTTCSNHSSFSYLFTVADKSIEGSGRDDDGNPSCRSLKSGDRIFIYYLASDPLINVPGDPKSRLNNESISVVMVALTAPLFIVFVIYKFAEYFDSSASSL